LGAPKGCIVASPRSRPCLRRDRNAHELVAAAGQERDSPRAPPAARAPRRPPRSTPMSTCRRTVELDQLAQGELPAATAAELTAHADRCGVCGHELRWLLSERGLFSQRAAREHASVLWERIEQRQRPARRM